MKTKVEVTIAGSVYIVTGNELEDYIQKVARMVDKSITEIAKNSKYSIAQAAVLTAMNYCDEALKAQSSSDNLRSQMKNYLDEVSAARTENNESKREIVSLTQEVQNLKMQLVRMENMKA